MFLVDEKRKGVKRGNTKKNSEASEDSRLTAKVETLKEKGNEHFKSNEFLKAVEFYKAGLGLEPTNVHLNCNLAQAYLAQGEYLDAEVHAVITLAQQGDSVKGFYRAAKATIHRAKKDRALHYLQKGILTCPNADNLKYLYQEMNNCNKDTKVASGEKGTAEMNSVTAGSDLLEKKADKDTQNKQRSRSVCSHPNEKPIIDARSISVSRLRNEVKLSLTKKINKGPIEPQDIQKDQFLNMLDQVKKDIPPDEKPPHVKARDAFEDRKEKLILCMKEGSEALNNGLARHASEKYKIALELMTDCNIEVFGMSEVDRIVLKYSLSISDIDTLNYGNIVHSIGCLTEIETNHVAKLPAVYYGLGHAFYRLNRCKTALQHLEKGIRVVERNIKITPHPWPGTMNTICETTRVGLKESLYKLVNNCKIYREPDAVCRYKSCLSISTHISPSELIFYSDPDYIGFVVVICQENCKIAFHIGCWKDYKENQSSLKKLSDKDMLGRPCLTSDCVTQDNEPSVIVRIEIYGDDGNMKAHCYKDPVKGDTKADYIKKDKKRKNERVEKPVKDKGKPTPRRQRKITSESQGGLKKVKRKGEMTGNELTRYMNVLDDLRSNIWLRDSYWDPSKDFFGQKSVSLLKTYLNPNETSDAERERKDFIFTYFFEYLNKEGPQKINVIEQKWKDEVFQFPGVNEFMSKTEGICDFLLQSFRFASIDDYMCLSHQMTNLYLTVQIEVGESALFIVSEKAFSVPLNDSDTIDLDGATVSNNVVKSKDMNGIYHWDNQSEDVFYSESEDEFEYGTDGGSEDDMDIDMEILASTGSEMNNDTPDFIQHEVEEQATCTIYLRNSPPPTTQQSQVYTPADNVIPDKIDYGQQVSVGNVFTPSNMEPKFKDVEVQTDGPDYCKLYHSSTKEVAAVKQELTLYKDLNKSLKSQVDTVLKKSDDIQKKSEAKLEVVTASYEKKLQDSNFELTKKDGNVDAVKKKYQEELEKLKKRIEEEVSRVKSNVEVMGELTRELETMEGMKKRLQDQLRKATEEILNTRRSFGDYMLDSYLAKSKEKLESLEPIVVCLENTELAVFLDMKQNLFQCLKTWKDVDKELQDSKDLLEVQYDILSQQVRNNVSPEGLLQLQLPELPKEPPDCMMHLQNFVVKALEQSEKSIKEKKSGASSPFRSEPSPVPSHTVTPSPRPSPVGTPLQTTFAGQDLYMQQQQLPFRFPQPSPYYFNTHMGSSPFRMGRPSHYSALNFGASLRLPPAPPLSPNTLTATLPSTFDQSNPLLKASSSEHLSHLNGSLLKPLESDEKKNMNLITAKDKQFFKSAESLPCVDLGWMVTVGKHVEKKVADRKFSSVAGLIPIESTKAGPSQGTKTPSVLKHIIHNGKTSGTAHIRWNYQRLLDELQTHFRAKPETELSECLCVIRERNGNKLSGLSVPTIIRKVEKILEERSNKRVGNMGMDKFGCTAWGEVKNDVNWEYQDAEEECVICHVHMGREKTTLPCKHSFHTECIRKWLLTKTSSTCPVCRKYTSLVDEFPPLKK